MRTGLSQGGRDKRRYLWTDAFAVCNFLELFRRTSDQQYLRCAEELIYQSILCWGDIAPMPRVMGGSADST